MRAQAGNRSAIAALLEHLRPKIEAAATTLIDKWCKTLGREWVQSVGVEWEDMVQEANIAILDRLPEFAVDGEATFKTWITPRIEGSMKDYLKRLLRHQALSIDIAKECGIEVGVEYDGVDDQQRLYLAHSDRDDDPDETARTKLHYGRRRGRSK